MSWLEERAEELFGTGHLHARLTALQLAREALEAAAKDIDERWRSADYDDNGWYAARDIIRSFIEKPGATPRVDQRPAPATTEPPAHLSDAAEEDEIRAWVSAGKGKLSDADALVRAAEIMESISGPGFMVGTHTLRDQAAKLRAAEEVDVFESFRAYWEDSSSINVAADARAYFGPLVSALEEIAAKTEGCGPGAIWRQGVAQKALSALRERARAAGGGR